MIYFILGGFYAVISTVFIFFVYVIWDAEFIHPTKGDWRGLYIACFLMFFLWPVFVVVKFIHMSAVRLFGDD